MPHKMITDIPDRPLDRDPRRGQELVEDAPEVEEPTEVGIDPEAEEQEEVGDA